MYGQIIDERQKFVDRGKRFNAQLLGPLFREERIVPDHAHFQGLGPGGNRLPDAPQANDADRLVGQLGAHVLVAVPAPFDQALVCGGNVARQGQHHGQRMFGRAERVARRRVHHHDAQSRGRGLIDVVGADAGANNGSHAAIALQRIGGDLHAAAQDCAFELVQGLAKCVARQADADLVFDAGGFGQDVEPFLGQFVENDDSGHGRANSGEGRKRIGSGDNGNPLKRASGER